MFARSAALLLLIVPLAACRRGDPPPRAAQASKPLPDGPGQLALVRAPPPPCFAPHAHPTPQQLVERGGDALDEGEETRALACAEEAVRAAPAWVPALRLRASALSALGRAAEARLAWARALAADADDPETLLGAARLYVDAPDADHDALALGLAYALRGAERAQRGRARDRDLARRLLTLAASAENELGSSAEALEHADTALGFGPKDLDARYEKGVALYELCRFREAKAELERLVAAAPDDAWALHQLSLVAERTGDPHRADRLERRARALAPDAFPPPVDVDRGAFEAEVRRAMAALPDADRRALAAVPVEVEDVPSLEDLTAVDPPLSPAILGLYRGPSATEPCLPEDGATCRSIVFYRKNLARFARDRTELAEQVRVTLLHELGHLRGESDDELRARGLQ
ncbi:MAG TPA: metallopeptidase family protein [Anaeromyxobacteraceae bacterium]|nr:metallopeptidase family protein [Anaeromyxobacteraceae bacterium]